jgi:uridine phosphorylase
MPRPERPLAAGDHPLLRFAAELRTLRSQAGQPTYRALAAKAHYSSTTLSSAAAGRSLPSLAVTLAYVRACGGDPTEWEPRWHTLAADLATPPPHTAPDTDSLDGAPYVGLSSFQSKDTVARTRYREQVRRIAPYELHDRQDELAALARFCADPGTAGEYCWWRARAWSGKSALLSWFVLHPPAGVHIVSFFITARLASQNDRAAFVDNLLEQILAMLGQTLPAFLSDTTKEALLLGLLADAAQRCRDRGEQFVLVVDGLDEDRGVHASVDWHSIAAVLPAQPPAGMRVIVASRADPPVPDDVAADHPLRDPAVRVTLTPSSYARELHRQMDRELAALLADRAVGLQLLGLAVAAGGGLSADDLAELIGTRPWEVKVYLKSVAGRSFTSRPGYYRPASTPVIYLLAHEELAAIGREQIGTEALAGYRDRLHIWAQRYRVRGWPADTPQYLLRGYHDMLVQANDLTRLAECALDRHRQERLLDLSGGDSAALSEIVKAMDVCAAVSVPDLNQMLRLAVHRDRLRDRNRHYPAALPAAWVSAGQIDRAEALALVISNNGNQQTSALKEVAVAVAPGDPDRAEQIARTIVDPNEQGWALRDVAAVVAPGDPDRAEQIARTIVDPNEQGWALRDVAAVVAPGDPDRAEQIAHTITNPHPQSQALTAVAVALAPRDAERAGSLLQDAEQIARTITDPCGQARALSELAAVVAPHDAAWAGLLLHDAEQIARTLTDPHEHALALREVAAVVAPGDPDRAEHIAHTITDDDEQGLALGEVAAAVAPGDPDRAEQIAHTIPSSSQQASALRRVAAAVAPADLERAEQITHAITEPNEQARALSELAAIVAPGDPERAEQLARTITDPRWQASTLGAVAAAVAPADPERAEQLACAIPNPRQKAWALLALAVAVAPRDPGRAVSLLNDTEQLARTSTNQQTQTMQDVAAAVAPSDPERAEHIAHTITDPHKQAQALREVAAAVAPGDPERAELIAHTITDPYLKAWALLEVAVAMAPGDPERAELIARTFTTPHQQAHALWEVAAVVALGDPERAGSLLHDAEQLARTITNLYEQALALCGVAMAVAPHDAERAVRIAHTITDDDQRSQVLQNVAAVVAPAAPERAEQIARTITDPYRQAVALGGVAAVVTPRDSEWAGLLLHEAEQLARTISNPEQTRALREVALTVAPVDPERAEQIVRTIAHDGEQAWAMRKVVAAVAPSDPGRAERIARTITNPDQQAQAVRKVAAAVASRDPERAEQIARSIGDPNQQARALRDVAAAVASSDPERAEQIARSITNPDEQAQALQKVIEHANAEQVPQLVAQRLRLARWDRWPSDLLSLAGKGFDEAIRELGVDQAS